MNFQHDYPFDPSGGYSPEDLLALRPEIDEPADFDAFWRETRALALETPLDWSIRPSTTEHGDDSFEVFDVEFASLAHSLNSPGPAPAWTGADRIGGWLVRPRGRPAKHGAIQLHGYNGRPAPEPAFPVPPGADIAVFYPCCTGLPLRSVHTGIPPDSARHVLHGIESRETYVHRFCTADVWRAVSVLLEIVPELNENRPASGGFIDLFGASFGGGIGALALPWENRFRKAHLSVPSFGNHPLRYELPCCGSGESVRHHVKDHPEAKAVLAYFDAAIAARRIQIPVLVEAANFDPGVPPAGQFSVYHSLGGEKHLHVSPAGHFEHAGQTANAAALWAKLTAFFAG